MEDWIVWSYTGFALVAMISGIGLWLLISYRRAASGKIWAEFWPESGLRYRRLLPVEDNGFEVKAPTGHSCPRYFFNRETKGSARYPENPFLGLKLLQTTIPIVTWAENNPEPITSETHAVIATSSLINSLRDDDFAAFAMAASKEIQDLERELAKALANQLDKRIVYGGLALAILAAAVGAVICFQVLPIAEHIEELIKVLVG